LTVTDNKTQKVERTYNPKELILKVEFPSEKAKDASASESLRPLNI
jgi:plastocyanin domain-containing protein